METAANFLSNNGTIALAAAITMAAAVMGGTRAQGQAASTALEGVARNPSAASVMTTPLILSLALIESLVIFTFVIAFTLAGKV